MSIKLMSQVWEVQSLSQPRKMLLLAVADFANDEGLSWPSVETLMRKCSFKSDSGVRRALSELCDDGWLTKTTRSNKASNGRRVQGSNYYQISLAKLLKESCEPSPRTPSKQNIEPAHSEGSCGDHSCGEGSCYEGSCGSKNGSYEPAPRTPDPSVNSKQDPSDKKPICQPAAQPDPEVILTESAKQVLTHLNKVTGSRYQVSKTSLENIRARLGEGFTVDELSLTVDYLTAKWGTDLDMAEYLRPTTLFQPSKFPGYLETAKKWDKAGKPHRENGQWVKQNGQPVAGADNTERDAAYRRFIGNALPTKNPSKIETQVRAAASKAGLKSARPEFAMSRWNAIWKEVASKNTGEGAA
ncbi:conserved phage C-terminal domain-containing protein [Dickeya ananatis]|uniref:conserved phage C-terminal domain-containing protein n=1 Tax=Dickeya ananatis TaxID=3061286 RepID=UPI00388F9D78